MSNQWAPPVPSRPPGWTPHPNNQYQHQQQQQQGPSPGHYDHPQYNQQQGSPPPQQYQSYPSQQRYQTPSDPPSRQVYQQQYPPQNYAPPLGPPPQQSYQYPPQQYAPPPGPPSQHYSQYQHQQSGGQRQFWQPRAGTTWNMVLHDPVKLDDSIEDSEVWILDIFDNDASAIAELHRRGRKVIGYFSGGTWEDWRPDAKKFSKQDIGKSMEDWEGEKWLQTSSPAVRQIMVERIELALSKGFDGIDVDNVDGYDHKTGLKLTHESAADYIKFLSHEAHSRGLACGLKNAADIIPRVIDDVQWIVQEQCVQYGDEEEYLPFIRHGKPVFNVEYPKGEDTDSHKCNNTKEVTGKPLQKCMKAKNMGYSTIIKNIKLDQWIQVV